MKYQAPKSTCQLCLKEFTKKGMTNHIKKCLQRHAVDDSAKGKSFSYLVITAGPTDYFLHILISENAKLSDLDSFLRDIWVECCGHMSSFSYERWGKEISMNKTIKSVLQPESTLSYIYDFGTSTELDIKMVEHIVLPKNEMRGKIKLLARNAPLIVPCSECGKKSAVEICTECVWDGGGLLCEDCIESHECDEDMLLPFVNSPRAGLCGYTG